MSIGQLWLPILVSSIVVVFASSMAWMVLPHHKKDIKVFPNEKAWMEHLAKTDLAPGLYM